MWRITLASIAAHRRRLLATGLAVLLGVAFLAGTLVLYHTLLNGFSDVVTEANNGTDALVRSSRLLGREEINERGLVDRSLAATIATVDGVAAVAPRIESSGRIVGADGDPIGAGAPTVAGNWVTDARLNPYDLAEGRAPAAPGEVVIDKAAAEHGELAVGDTTVVRTPDRVEVRIVGLATFGGADSQGSATYAGFTTGFADQVLLPEPGKASSIAVAATPGVSQAELVRRLDAVLPDGVEALTGAELTRELEEETQGEDHEAFQQALLLFACIALVVATLTIYNTFSILVVQRTRESALLRALGASRGQVLRSVTTEALAVGLLASVGGIAAGMGLALGLLALMDAIGLTTPASPLVLEASTVRIALAVGVVVTLVASLAPAVRASRVAPLAALRDVAVDRSATSRRRAVTGAVAAGAGITLSIVGATGQALPPTGLGALATLIGVVVLGPVVARPAAGVLGAPLAAWRGMSGVLARRNAMRNPRRTAGTAMALVIGVGVVSLFSVVGASLKQSIDDAVEQQFAGDLVIIGEGAGGLSTDLAAAVAELPEVAAASPEGGGPARIDGESMLVPTFDPATIESVENLPMRQGSLGDVRRDQVAISADYADQHGLALGDPVTVDYPDGVTERPTVGAIYAEDKTSESGGIRLHRDAYLPHTSRPADVNLRIALAGGVPVAEGEAAVQRVADRFGAPDAQTNQEFTESIAGEINLYLTVVYVLLVLAIVIAVMGIANTLSLSIHERTREFGLLRAVGQTRRQTRTMVRGEALTVGLFGTAGGLGLGLFLGWALVSALAGEGFGSFAVPKLSLAVVLALGALVGVLAAVLPAHRAARLDVLSAIAASE
ncbi:MAG TPA: ABC transporter permease [Actinomycetota bacterium]|jgi:putative ABC transport system permease protein|nr:ABC transporter permease [Actinomycetota bacterium]